MFEVGDVLAFSGNGIIGNMVKYITKSNITHVAMIINNESLIESRFGSNVRIIEFLNNIGTYNGKIYLYKLNKDSRRLLELNNNVLNDCISQIIDKKYDIKLIFKFLFSVLLPIKWGENLRRFICSELIGYIYNYVGITDIENICKLTPNDITNLSIFSSYDRIK